MPKRRELLNHPPIHFIRTKDKWGRECYCFLLASDLKIRLLKAALKNPIVDLTRYGKVLASGFGHVPSEADIALLMEKYGFDARKFA